MKNSLGDVGENGVEKQLSVLRGRFSPRVFLEDASRVLCRFFAGNPQEHRVRLGNSGPIRRV